MFKIFVSLTLAGLVSACAPASHPANIELRGFGELSESRISSSLDGGTTCTGSANIIYKSDYNHSGTHDYTVCKSGNGFKVSGQLNGAQCIYPMHSSSSGQSIILVAAPQCVNFVNGETSVNFSDAANINYMIIVEYQYAAAMNSCLSGVNACPAYSEGFVQ